MAEQRLIDANALKDDIDTFYADSLFLIDSICERIDAQTTIEPERQTGKWIGADSQCGIKCPFCGIPVDDFCNSIDYIDLIYEPNFCPNCGAKMKGEQP